MNDRARTHLAIWGASDGTSMQNQQLTIRVMLDDYDELLANEW
jgi:hypothetical protein